MSEYEFRFRKNDVVMNSKGDYMKVSAIVPTADGWDYVKVVPLRELHYTSKELLLVGRPCKYNEDAL